MSLPSYRNYSYNTFGSKNKIQKISSWPTCFFNDVEVKTQMLYKFYNLYCANSNLNSNIINLATSLNNKRTQNRTQTTWIRFIFQRCIEQQRIEVKKYSWWADVNRSISYLTSKPVQKLKRGLRCLNELCSAPRREESVIVQVPFAHANSTLRSATMHMVGVNIEKNSLHDSKTMEHYYVVLISWCIVIPLIGYGAEKKRGLVIIF